MLNSKNLCATIVLSLGFLAVSGCDLFKHDSSSANQTTTSGGTFTGSDLNGTWQTGCTAGTSGLNAQGASYFIASITLFGGNSFNYSQVWYSDAACNPGNLRVQYSVGGSYTVGGVI